MEYSSLGKWPISNSKSIVNYIPLSSQSLMVINLDILTFSLFYYSMFLRDANFQIRALKIKCPSSS